MKPERWMRGNLTTQGGAVAGWSSRHPFDYIWNGAVRHLARGPQLPPNPVRRRHSFNVTVINFCIPSMVFARLERRGRREVPA